MTRWQQASDRYDNLTSREKVLVLLTGLVLIIMLIFNFVLDGIYQNIDSRERNLAQLNKDNLALSQSMNELQLQLANDPNKVLKQQIESEKATLAAIDQELLTLTSEMIDPIEMRLALQELLKRQPGVKIMSFRAIPAQPVLANQQQANNLANADESQLTSVQPGNTLNENLLYRHGIELTLKGKYFELRDYLALIETLPWQFFWHQFELSSTDYPESELKLSVYSLSMKREFIGV